MSTTEQSRALVLQFHELLASKGPEAASALVAEGCVNHAALPEAQGRAGLLRILTKVRAAFPDAAFRIENVIADGDRVFLRMTFTGTQSGRLDFLRFPVEATNRRVEVLHMHEFRIADGKIVEHWACRDDIAQFRQLGMQILPPAAQSTDAIVSAS